MKTPFRRLAWKSASNATTVTTVTIVTIVAVWSTAVLLAVLLSGCAEIVAPPGGDPDTTPPKLLESRPVSGALDVPLSDEIVLVFSERLEAPASGRAVFISPRPPAEPKVKFKGSEIHIELGAFFASDQTYVVTVSNEVQDLRRNKLTEAATIAFSTGDAIDSGVVSGIIYENDKVLPGAIGGLWRIEADSVNLPFDSLYPDYTTTSNSDGRFTFQYLPEGTYRLVVFKDQNNNELFNPAKEQFAVPDRKIEVGGTLSVDDLVLHATRYDSVTASIQTVVHEPGDLVRVRLSQPITTALLAGHPSNLQLKTYDSIPRSLPALGIRESNCVSTDVVTAWFGPLEEGAYAVEMTYDVTLPTMERDSLTVQERSDSEPPAITSFEPGEGAHFPDGLNVRFHFSEPLDIAVLSNQTFVLWNSEGTPIPISHEWMDAFRLSFLPQEIRPGESYRLDMAQLDIVDYAGNRLGDSLQSFSFSVLDQDSLGSVSGTIEIGLPDRAASAVLLTFHGIASGRDYAGTFIQREFAMDLPPGKYLLTGIVDEDDNDKLSPGGVAPYRRSETFVSHPDTISVRARFETAGVVVVVD